MTTKSPMSVYLDPDLMNTLAAYADRRGKSRSLIAEAAIASFLSPDADEQRKQPSPSGSIASIGARPGLNGCRHRR